MAADGIEEVIVQPTHVINRIENDRMLQEVMEHMHLFRKVYVGNRFLVLWKIIKSNSCRDGKNGDRRR